jgi:hypothetical protein
MWDMPKVLASDPEVMVTGLERRRSRPGTDDWYVTWTTRSSPWEVSVTRLPSGRDRGRAWHHGRAVNYQIGW